MMTYGTVARETRFLIGLTIAVIAPFGFLLYLFPSSAGDYWAWEIAQPRTAMLVGSIYFATSIYYVLLSRQRGWLRLEGALAAACARVAPPPPRFWGSVSPHGAALPGRGGSSR